MKKIGLFFLIFLRAINQSVFAQSFDIDIAGFGFNKGIAAQVVSPGEKTEIMTEELIAEIPEGEFDYPVTFEILQGENDYFQDGNLGSRKVIFNFAFRVREHQNNRLVGQFRQPVLVTISLPKDLPQVEIWEMELTRPPIMSKSTQSFEKDNQVLKIQINNPRVGWLIVSSTANDSKTEAQIGKEMVIPKIDLSPIVGLFLGGAIFFLIRKMI